MASRHFSHFALTSQQQGARLPPQMTTPSPASARLPHLDGLRALAILGVLLYHLNSWYCPAGYFGVDVFLVISGFLLFGSLLRPGAAGSFRFGTYLQKKAWRLLPAWLAVTLVTAVAAAWLLYPAQLAETMQTAAASAGFVADYVIDHSGDYFNPLSQQNPLLHFWYLSLTIQLYLLAPLLLIPLARRSRRAAMALLAALALLSLAFHLLTAQPNALGEKLLQGIGARSAYYHLIPRFWEVAAGAAVCLLPTFATHPRLRAALGLAGLAAITASFYLYATGSPAVYLAVAGTLLAIRYADAGPAARLLNSRPVQGLGLISFSLYLWHWPLMVFWKYCRFDNPTFWDEAGMLAASLLFGYVGWRILERLHLPNTLPRRAALLLCLPLVAAGALVLGERAGSYAAAHPTPLQHMQLIKHPLNETDTALLHGLEHLPQLGLVGKPLRLGTEEGETRFLLIGDSHAQHLYDALHEACLGAGLRGLYLNNTVSPYLGLIQPQVGADTCRWDAAIEQCLLDYLRAHPNIRHVLIAQCWQMRMTEGYGVEAATGQALSSKKARGAVTARGLGLFCDRLRAQGVQPVLLGETPRFSRPYPLEEWHRREMLGVGQRERRMTVAAFEERHAFPLTTLRSLAAEGRAELIELTPALRTDAAYPARHEGEFWYYDANHLTPTAARRVTERCLLPWLQRELRSPH